MAKKNTAADLERRRKIIAEEMWLKYFNQALFEQGKITERERNQMINKINARTGKCLAK